MRLIATLALAAALTSPVSAAERRVTITGFDTLVVQGASKVRVESGVGPSARVIGDPAAAERVAIEQTGERLTVRSTNSAAMAYNAGPVEVVLTTPLLRQVSASGSGAVAVDRLGGDQPKASLAGSGTLAIGAVEADRFGVTLAGTGSLSVAGHVKIAGFMMQGSGALDAAGLDAGELSILAAGSGSIKASATQRASVNAAGSVTIAVAGDVPCLTKVSGSANVICGRADQP